MSEEQILAMIKEIANEKHINVKWDQPNFATLGFKELGIDSLDLFDMISTLEERLSIHFSDETLMELKNFNDLVVAIKTIS